MWRVVFFNFLCFVGLTSADYAFLAEETTAANLLACILMNDCMCVAARLRGTASICRCVFLFFSSPVWFHVSIKEISLITGA